MKIHIPFVLCTFVCSAPAVAQTGASIVHAGYQADRPIRVAPGQVLHLTLHGLTTMFDSTQVATTIPLPTDFHGLSVTLQQTGNSQAQLLPLLHGQATDSCFGSVPFNSATAIDCPGQDPSFDLVVQIPFELRPNNPGADNGPCPTPACVLTGLNDAVLTVREQSGQGMSLRVAPVMDQIHFLNTCTDNIDLLGQSSPSVYITSPCYPAIFHNDNKWVTAANPARAGEVLTAYAFGLGLPSILFPTASGTPTAGVAVDRPFRISFTGGGSLPVTSPDYVGLVGGNAGLYQVNFRVPELPASIVACTHSPTLLTQVPVNTSNFTVTLTGSSSVDQASFCVK